jgi:hypothetical protein
MFLSLWRYHHIHRTNRHLLNLCLHDLFSLLLLDSPSEPKYELTQVFFLRRKHFQHTILLLFVTPEQCTHTFLIGLPSHLWIEVADDGLTLADRVNASYEEGEDCRVWGELEAFIEQVLV